MRRIAEMVIRVLRSITELMNDKWRKTTNGHLYRQIEREREHRRIKDSSNRKTDVRGKSAEV